MFLIIYNVLLDKLVDDFMTTEPSLAASGKQTAEDAIELIKEITIPDFQTF